MRCKGCGCRKFGASFAAFGVLEFKTTEDSQVSSVRAVCCDRVDELRLELAHNEGEYSVEEVDEDTVRGVPSERGDLCAVCLAVDGWTWGCKLFLL